jgi:hypothetical protein
VLTGPGISDPKTARAFLNQLIALLRSPPSTEERLAMSRAARETFSWHCAAEAFARILVPSEKVKQTGAEMQAVVMENGAAQLSGAEIDAEIAATRAERGARNESPS